MNEKVLAVLSEYERVTVTNCKGSKIEELSNGKRTQTIVDAILSCKVSPMELQDGTVVTPTIEEVLIASAIQAELDKPKGLESIERLQKIRGELDDNKTQVNLSLVDKDLQKRALE